MFGERASSNKAAIARRVVEVLDFFDEDRREARVMDIARHFGRPQSSTSELLFALVEVGLLRKNSHSRTYSLSPRAALMGSTGQPEIIRDGQLLRLLDKLAGETGLTVAIFGRVLLNAQIMGWRSSTLSVESRHALQGGAIAPLSETAVSRLLLASLPHARRSVLLRHLNHQARDEFKFDPSIFDAQIEVGRATGHIKGPLGFRTDAEVLAMCLPLEFDDHAMAVGVIYNSDDQISEGGLLHCLRNAVNDLLLPTDREK